MAWARLDDRLNDADSKLLAVSDAAHRMYTCGLVYVQKALTDGFIPEHVIETFGVRAKHKRAIAEELCTPLVPGKQSLWHKVPGGYQVHDYLDWNDNKETIVEKRQRLASRVSQFRKRHGNALCNALQGGVTQRVTPPPISAPVTRSVRTDPRTTYLASLGTRTAAAPRPAPVDNPGQAFRVVSALVRATLAEGADWAYPTGEADLMDELKTRCAKARLPYDTELVRKALDSERAKAQRQEAAS